MRRITWVLAIMMSVALIMTGCGKKDAASVVKDLNNVADKLESKQGAYQGSGTMTLYTGEQPQEYKVEVWYKNPSYYRISLANVQKDITQIVLRNDEGVFVLTPSLNKSFRFQSDWPDNQGQVYLYQTLVRGIVSDNNRQFVADGDNYVFEVAANYQSSALVRQKIWLDKKSYAPKQVQVSDSEAKVVVDVKFDNFKFDPEFTKDSFDMQKNMTAGTASESTVAEVDENGNPVVVPEGQEQSAPQVTAELGDFGIIEPGYVPSGVEFKDSNKIESSKDHAVLIRYDGIYQYTIMESRPLDRAVSLAPGSVIDLGFTVGLLSGDEQQTLTWMNEGVEYRITSANLPVSEMMQIAASMEEQSGK
ncbi:outer membrane lipoprotein carrier protein LolA [Paenibacillus sp. 19GGS1-52]|uniref:LolA family protein n=1 Tax=Paenibacillus sp. 19GGS1-52 TaxID=2758563 RepID=UPI001EFB1D76|nr:outer membrane lipoprotein carrier protein LolA [Paenibacillus sp. 19GGS1-52]ULO06516.1 outer membrane lipoprotein carrier protein LolA [Paenibacillus sp. 19GGS1-52]